MRLSHLNLIRVHTVKQNVHGGILKLKIWKKKRKTEKDRERERKTEKDRERERKREKEREKERKREKERERMPFKILQSHADYFC